MKTLSFFRKMEGLVAGINEMGRRCVDYFNRHPNIKEFRLELGTLKSREEIDEGLNEIITQKQDTNLK